VEDSEGDITTHLRRRIQSKTEISVAKNGQEALDFLFKRGHL
jgi:hypothetical protein